MSTTGNTQRIALLQPIAAEMEAIIAELLPPGFAAHAVVEVKDAQPWPQSFVRPQGQQEVDGISTTRHGYPNAFRR